jgi:hypothetical protein
MLPVALLQHSNADAERGLLALPRRETSDPTTAPGRSTSLAPARDVLAAHTLQLQRQVAAAGTADPNTLEAVAVESASLKLRVHIATLQHDIGDLLRALDAVDEGIVAKTANLLRFASMELMRHALHVAIMDLGLVETELATDRTAAINAKYDALPPSDGRELAREFELRQSKRKALDAAEQRLATTLKVRGLNSELFKRVETEIADARLRALIVTIAANIAIAIASGGIANVAGELVAGVAAGARTAATVADAASIARTARIAGSVTNFVVDAGVSAAGQTALQGGKVGSSFVENILSNVAVLAALRPLQSMARSWGVLDEEAFRVWARQGQQWRIVASRGAYLTAEMITSAAVGYVTHRVMTAAKGETPDDETIATWAAQGATIVLGRFVHARLGDSVQRLGLLGRAAGDLVARTGRQMVLAAKVEHSPSIDAGMEVFIAHNQLIEEEVAVWRKLVDDPAALQHLGLAREQVNIRLHGAEAQHAETRTQAFAHLQLRLAGLQQEIAGETLWVGDTETVAIALAQANRAGFSLEIEKHDPAARTWYVKLDGHALQIRERAREGRVREAKAKGQVTDDDVRQAKRYSSAARDLRKVLDAHTKRVVEAARSFGTQVLQIGFGFGALMHLDTHFEHGSTYDPQSQLIIHTHDGAMTNRGSLPSGQNADRQTMPGVRAREHTTDHDAYNKSQDLADAMEVGRLEMQAAAYKARATKFERRADVQQGWQHEGFALRVEVVGEDGTARWIYCNHIHNAGGMGPTNFAPAQKIIGGTTASAESKAKMFDEMRARNVLLAGDDPDLSSKFHPGERVLVWGGSPSGAWAGEDAANHGSTATVVGESPEVHRTTNTDPKAMTASEFEAKLRRAAQLGNGDEVTRLLREWRISDTHKGSQIDRNRRPGATYGAGAKERGIDVVVGVPTELVFLPDGNVSVTVGIGEKPGTHIYDRIVMAVGQDVGAPGGQGGLLGPGAKLDGNPNAPVPHGTIALRMILHAGRLVGLESEDGRIQLDSAAYATPNLAPWVIPSERAEFVQKVRAIAAKGERSHTGETISSDSVGVAPGIEAQRDRVPLANEVTGARDYKLPDHVSADRLSLPKDRPEEWAVRLEDFLTASMRARPGRLEVTPLPSGRDGVHLFHVTNGGQEVGIVRVYDSMSLEQTERKLAQQVKALVPSLDPGVERGTMIVAGGTTAQLTSHPRDAHVKPGVTFDALVEAWLHAPAGSKDTALANLKAATVRTAHTLAELHNKFAQDGGALMTPHAKQHEIQTTYTRLDSPQVKRVIGDDQRARIRAQLKPLADRFMQAKLPATVELGHAEASAFRYHDGLKTMSVADVGAMRRTLDASTGKGVGTGTADVARFLESLHGDSRLGDTSNELQRVFRKEYQKELRGSERSHIEVGIEWYRTTAAIERVERGEPGAAAYLVSLLAAVRS